MPDYCKARYQMPNFQAKVGVTDTLEASRISCRCDEASACITGHLYAANQHDWLLCRTQVTCSGGLPDPIPDSLLLPEPCLDHSCCESVLRIRWWEPLDGYQSGSCGGNSVSIYRCTHKKSRSRGSLTKWTTYTRTTSDDWCESTYR